MVRWKLGRTVYLHWVSLNNTACAYIHIHVSSGFWKLMPLYVHKSCKNVSQIRYVCYNFGLGSARDSPKMEALCEFIGQLPHKSVEKFE